MESGCVDELSLSSPMGSASMVYTWPLKKGKGSLRRSEDKQDEAAEIVDTIRWVCEDCPAIKDFMDSSNLLNTYDPHSFESMTELCNTYNKAVEKYVSNDLPLLKNKKSDVSRAHLRHIIQKCYNKSVTDPNLLNHYEAFTPEVYGETSFELICQILDKLHPIGPENKFVDLGSGVGQVVLQVAALSECSHCLGIEKSNIPAKYAQDLEKWFRFWMNFYGKKYSDFKIVHGDFLEKSYRSEILESTIVFVNNFAFGPEVDQQLKYIFAELNDGARIFSSKSFCALNFRISERNLSDIGTIMHVSKMDPLKGSVSWTGKPVSYYLHVIDRAKLERFFLKNAASKKSGLPSGEPPSSASVPHLPSITQQSPNAPHHNHHIPPSSNRKKLSLKSSSLDGGEEVLSSNSATPPPPPSNNRNSNSKSTSRSSSVERDAAPGDMTTTRKAWSEQIKSSSETATTHSEEATQQQTTVPLKGRRKGTRRTNKAAPKQDSSYLSSSSSSCSSTSSSSMSSTSPPHQPLPPPSAATAAPDACPPISTSTSSRPLRTAVANAVAISALEVDEAGAFNELDGLDGGGEATSLPRKRASSRLKAATGSSLSSTPSASSAQESPEMDKGRRRSRSSKISGLDFLHSQTLQCIKQSNEDRSAPSGCINLNLEKKNTPEILHHGEIPVSLNVDENGDPISYELKLYLQKCKKNFMDFMSTMKDPVYKVRLTEDLSAERTRHNELLSRKKALSTSVESLLGESLSILRSRLRELNITANSPPEFIERAKDIVALHHELQSKRKSLEEEVRRIQEENEGLVLSKEKELCEQVVKLRSACSHAEARDVVRREIEGVLLQSGGAKGLIIPPSAPTANTTLIKTEECVVKKEALNTSSSNPQCTPLLNKLSDVTFTKCEDSKREAKSSTRKWSSEAVTIEARPYDKQPRNHPHSSNHTMCSSSSSNSGGGVEVRRIESSPNKHSRLVDLPKIDLAQSMQAVNGSRAAEISLLHPSEPREQEPSFSAKVLSGSGSSTTTTPRAEQFQDRLKTIIHSVLSADEEVRAGGGGSIQSHGKRHHPLNKNSALPAAAAGSNHNNSNIISSSNASRRTMNDLIQSEIEKSLSGQQQQQVQAQAHQAPHPSSNTAPLSANPAATPSTMSRMSRVIEDSIRSQMESGGGGGDLEGLAVPRRSSRSPDVVYNKRTDSHQPHSQRSAGGGVLLPSYQMEGLAARYYEQSRKRPGSPPNHHHHQPHPNLPSPCLPPKKQHLEDSRGGPPSYRGNPQCPLIPKEETQKRWQDEISTGFDRLVAYATEVVDKRRKSSDSSSPGHLGGNNAVSLSSERKEVHHLVPPPAQSQGNTTNVVLVTSEPERFDNRMSTLGVKFKGAAAGLKNSSLSSPPPKPPPSSSLSDRVPTPGSSSSRAGTPASSSRDSTGSRVPTPRSPLPGENLPEHHPKKRYFAESRLSLTNHPSPRGGVELIPGGGGGGNVPYGPPGHHMNPLIMNHPYSQHPPQHHSSYPQHHPQYHPQHHPPIHHHPPPPPHPPPHHPHSSSHHNTSSSMRNNNNNPR